MRSLFFIFLMLVGSIGYSQVTLPVDFEQAPENYDFLGFEGSDSAIEANPDQSGINTSGNVMRALKTEGSQFFAGTFVNLDEAIDFSESGVIAVDTWSPKLDIPVRLRLENADNSAGVEMDVNTATINEWETLEWDLSGMINPDVDYVRVVVFFEFIVDLPGDGTTYYFDNIRLGEGGGGGSEISLPLTFELPASDYDFLGFEGSDSAIEANPDQSGINTSATIMRATKTEGAQFFAGTLVNLDVPVDFSESGVVSVDVWSPKADIPVRMRLEDAGNTAGIELDVNIPSTNEWVTLDYDFSGVLNPDINYVRVVLFFEFVVDLPGDGTTYYFDNVRDASSLSAESITASQYINAWPNPATDVLNIEFLEGVPADAQLTIYDLSGRMIDQLNPQTQLNRIDLSSYDAGQYVLRIDTQDKGYYHKFIIAK